MYECVCLCVGVYMTKHHILTYTHHCLLCVLGPMVLLLIFSEEAIGCLGTLQAGLECLPETRQKSQRWSWAGHADPLILVQGLYTGCPEDDYLLAIVESTGKIFSSKMITVNEFCLTYNFLDSDLS